MVDFGQMTRDSKSRVSGNGSVLGGSSTKGGFGTSLFAVSLTAASSTLALPLPSSIM